jgi:pimeloyl-ACP methyl ester carboxylesterase
MKPLARRLREAGYDVRPWSYPSFRGRLKEHGDALADELTRLTNELEGTKIHIVAHSMGCIVTRAALRKVQSETIGRVVLLAPPNRGSNWAWLLSPIVKYLIPTVYDLSTARTSYVGIVRADFDLLVPRFSIELSEQMDFISFPTTHLGLLLRRDVAETVISFLKKGAFPMPSRHDH